VLRTEDWDSEDESEVTFTLNKTVRPSIEQKLMILLLKLKCTSEGVQQRQKIKKKGRGFPEQKTVEGLKTAGYRVTTAGSGVNVAAEINTD
ncbi:hypothetical protein Tco_0916371, partial [Tanacetum coccineum]